MSTVVIGNRRFNGLRRNGKIMECEHSGRKNFKYVAHGCGRGVVMDTYNCECGGIISVETRTDGTDWPEGGTTNDEKRH